MKTTNKKFFAACMLLALIGCSQHDNAAVTKYELSANEKSVLKALVYNEMGLYMQGGETTFAEWTANLLGNYTAVSSNELQREYERNEVAADMKFREKLLLVSGTIASIDRSVGESYYLSLKGGSNPFMQPKAAMADGYTDFLAGLNKGDEVEMMCTGNGMLIGSAMLSDCQPSRDYVAKLANNYVENINISDAIAKKDIYTTRFFIAGVALSSILPVSSACFSEALGGDKCMGEVMAIDKKEMSLAMENAQAKLGLKKNTMEEMRKSTKVEKPVE